MPARGPPRAPPPTAGGPCHPARPATRAASIARPGRSVVAHQRLGRIGRRDVHPAGGRHDDVEARRIDRHVLDGPPVVGGPDARAARRRRSAFFGGLPWFSGRISGGSVVRRQDMVSTADPFGRSTRCSQSQSARISDPTGKLSGDATAITVEIFVRRWTEPLAAERRGRGRQGEGQDGDEGSGIERRRVMDISHHAGPRSGPWLRALSRGPARRFPILAVPAPHLCEASHPPGPPPPGGCSPRACAGLPRRGDRRSSSRRPAGRRSRHS